MDLWFQPDQKFNIIWAQSREYNLDKKQKMHVEATAENTSGQHDVGRPKAAPRHMVAAATMW